MTETPSLTEKTRTLTRVLFILLVLLAATVLAAELPIGSANTVIGLAIAVAKASLVALYFMHLRHSTATPRIFGVIGLLWLAILIGLVLGDYLTR